MTHCAPPDQTSAQPRDNHVGSRSMRVGGSVFITHDVPTTSLVNIVNLSDAVMAGDVEIVV